MIKSKNICKNMYESIFTNKKIFNKMFLKSGISYEDIEGKSIKEIIKLFQTTFNCIDDNLSIKVEPISKDVEERIFNELEKTEEVKGGTNIRKDGITSSIDEDLLLGNISSCHINGDEITRTEKDKTLLYMKFIKNEIERVIPH